MWLQKLIGLVKFMLGAFLHGLKWVTGEGGWSFLPHEQLILYAAIASLPPKQQDKIHEQLDQPWFICRVGGNGRINAIFFNDKELQGRIDDPAFFEKIIVVNWKVDGKRQRARVTFYEGLIDTIQLQKERKFYRKAKAFEITSVKKGKPSDDLEKAIDRMEHGRDSHIATGEE